MVRDTRNAHHLPCQVLPLSTLVQAKKRREVQRYSYSTFAGYTSVRPRLSVHVRDSTQTMRNFGGRCLSSGCNPILGVTACRRAGRRSGEVRPLALLRAHIVVQSSDGLSYFGDHGRHGLDVLYWLIAGAAPALARKRLQSHFGQGMTRAQACGVSRRC
ncbi:hypothetical protein BJ546DRAFT_644154 [Cryomyces antarcticus]